MSQKSAYFAYFGCSLGCICMLLLFCACAKKSSIQTCQSVSIEVKDEMELNFISEKDVEKILRSNGLFPKDMDMQIVACNTIEELLEKNSFIAGAECYKTTNAEVVIKVTSRVPLVEVSTSKEHYYVDADGIFIPYKTVPNRSFMVLTGRIGADFTSTELFEFIRKMNEDSYWKRKIVQIISLGENSVELLLEDIRATVLLGDVGNYALKMEKLKSFLESVSAEELQLYKELDLRFNNQVVCRK